MRVPTSKGSVGKRGEGGEGRKGRGGEEKGREGKESEGKEGFSSARKKFWLRPYSRYNCIYHAELPTVGGS